MAPNCDVRHNVVGNDEVFTSSTFFDCFYEVLVNHVTLIIHGFDVSELEHPVIFFDWFHHIQF
jgi:hypothetical protein